MKGAVLQCMKAVRPEYNNRGTFVDNQCVKHEKAFLIPILNSKYSSLSLFDT